VARKNLKWQVNEAIMDSELPPPARLLMLVFSDLADAETGQIPEERKDGTSIKELARRTGLNAATVKRHKRDLVALGWLKYDMPDARQQSTHGTGDYTIAAGRNPEAQSAPSAGAHKEPPPEAHSAPPNHEPVAHCAPPGGAQCATPEAQSAPPIKGIPTPTSTTDLQASATGADEPGGDVPPKPKRKPRTAKPRASPDPAIAERRQLAEEIVRWWWNDLAIKPAGKNAWFASVATIEALLKVGYEPRDVAGALRAAGKPATIARLEIELERHGRRPSGAGPKSNDQHLADEMEWARQLEAEEAARQQPDTWNEDAA
jgi:hypothetical protein